MSPGLPEFKKKQKNFCNPQSDLRTINKKMKEFILLFTRSAFTVIAQEYSPRIAVQL